MRHRLSSPSARSRRLAATFGLLVLGCQSLSAAPQIIIKADDLRSPPSWQRFVDYIEANEMKASIGIITNSLESGSASYFAWIREQHDSGRIEFWHHGYDHSRDPGDPVAWWEFRNTDYTDQKFHFERGMQLGEEKLGIIFRTFGAPYNATDATTSQVLEENPDMRVWLYPSSASVTAGTSKLILNRISAVNIESTAGVAVEFETFAANYPAHAGEDVLVLQCHPASWSEASWSEFAQIVGYLKAEGATFTTPTAYFGIETSGKAIHLNIPVDTEAGARYRIQRSTDLNNWTVDGAMFFGTGERMTIQRVYYGGGSVFYRAEQLVTNEPIIISIVTDKDSYVRNGSAGRDTNYGTETNLAVDKYVGNIVNERETYIGFTLPVGVAIADIQLAEFQFFISAGGTNPSTTLIGYSGVNWGETTLTWNNKPAIGGNITSLDTPSGLITLDVTSYIQSLPAGTLAVSFVISNLGETAVTSAKFIRARERNLIEGEIHPTLVITVGAGSSM